MIAFIFLLLCANCIGVPVRDWAELDFILGPDPATGIDAAAEAIGGLCDTGVRQSPVNLDTCTVQKITPLRFYGHGDTRSDGFTLKNTGHSAQVEFKGSAPILNGGPLNGDYTLSQLHFHWGTANEGSEHSISGNFYALEGHFVHFKTSYGTVAAAATQPDGLAVVGFMFELSLFDNPDLTPIIAGLSNIHTELATTPLTDTTMNWFHKYINRYDYYTYPGSLTTSPCAESVTWLVLKVKSKISARQLAEFRKLEGPDGAILENRRPIKPLNTRTVYCEVGC